MTETDLRPGEFAGVEDAAPPERTDRGEVWTPRFSLLILFFVLEYMRPMVLAQFRLQMLIILWIPLSWLSSEERPWSRNLTLQTNLVVLCALSAIYAENYFSVIVTTRELLGHVSIALAITWVLSDRSRFVTATWIWLAIMSYQALFAITHGGIGTGGFVGDENDLALACSTAFPFAFLGFRHLPGWQRWASGSLAVLFAAAIVLSFSRGGFLGFAATGLYCVLAGRHRLRIIAIAMVAAVVFFLALPAEYKEELSTIQDMESGTALGRRFLWSSAFNMWTSNPLVGVGAGNSPWNIGAYQPESESGGMFNSRAFQDRDWTMQQVHSVYFQLLAEVGLVGCLLVVAILVGHFSVLRRLRHDVAKRSDAPPGLRRDVDLYTVALGGAMVGFLAGGVFLSVAYYPYLWYFSAMAVAFDRAVRGELPTLDLHSDV